MTPPTEAELAQARAELDEEAIAGTCRVFWDERCTEERAKYNHAEQRAREAEEALAFWQSCTRVAEQDLASMQEAWNNARDACLRAEQRAAEAERERDRLHERLRLLQKNGGEGLRFIREIAEQRCRELRAALVVLRDSMVGNSTTIGSPRADWLRIIDAALQLVADK